MWKVGSVDSQGVEVEKKYDVGADTEVPALAELPGVARVGEPHVDTLKAVYFDTPAHALASRGITLRRRTGGPDAGWHLKLPAEFPAPAGDASGSHGSGSHGSEGSGSGPEPQRRRELHAPLGQAAVVPDSLLAQLHVYLRGEDVLPVVRLETQRTAYPLYGEDGTHLADLADDRVTAKVQGPGGSPQQQQWREWELELVHGSPDLFPAAAELLAAAGAHPAQHTSKLAKALAGGGTGTQARPTPPDPGPPGKKGPVADLLTAYLAAQIREIMANDPGVRLGEPEAVHDLRSATRRSRSGLAAYRRIYDDAAVRHLRDELKWLGQVLGEPRDAEVMRDRLRGHAAELPPAPELASVKARLEEELGNTLDTAYRRLQKALLSERYFRLLDSLEAFRDNPPVRPDGSAPARKAAVKLVAKAAKRLRQAARTAKAARGGAKHETSLHQVRKDAKRLRHVAESVGPVHGKRAAKVAKAAHGQQKILGDFQDSVVARDLLAGLVAGPDLPEAVASAYITLHTRQVQLAADAEAKYRKAHKKSRGLFRRGLQ